MNDPYWVDYRCLTFRALLGIIVWGIKARAANTVRKYGINLHWHPSPPYKFYEHYR